MATRARPCAARTCLFWLVATPNGALCAPPPIAASLHASYSIPKKRFLKNHRTICSNFFRFILFKNCFLILSFLLYSSYSSLLISSYSSRSILPLLILLFFRNCDTHTHTHRQSILDKYMIDSTEEICCNQHFGSIPPPPAS